MNPREILEDYERVRKEGYGAGHHALLAHALRSQLDLIDRTRELAERYLCHPVVLDSLFDLDGDES